MVRETEIEPARRRQTRAGLAEIGDLGGAGAGLQHEEPVFETRLGLVEAQAVGLEERAAVERGPRGDDELRLLGLRHALGDAGGHMQGGVAVQRGQLRPALAAEIAGGMGDIGAALLRQRELGGEAADGEVIVAVEKGDVIATGGGEPVLRAAERPRFSAWQITSTGRAAPRARRSALENRAGLSLTTITCTPGMRCAVIERRASPRKAISS